MGLDVIFAEPDTINPNDDAILADSLRRNGRAVLPVVLDRLDHPGSMSLPIPALAQAAAGWLNAHRRRRRGARNVRVHYDGDWWRHLALTLLRIGGESDVAGRLLKRAQPDGGILIPIPVRRPIPAPCPICPCCAATCRRTRCGSMCWSAPGPPA